MERNKFYNLINRYLKGKANETEHALVDAWYKSYESDEQKIRIENSVKEEAKAKFRLKIKKKVRGGQTRKLLTITLKVAATVLLISGTTLILYTFKKSENPDQPKYTQIQTGIGKIKKVLLPDSSVIWLNAVSRIRIPQKFQGNIREVFLEEGEAFFEVQKNPQRPFIVHAATLNIKVLGTSFNIRSYRSVDEQKVMVKTGKVRVSQGKKLLGLLIPGDQISFNPHTAKTTTEHRNPANLANWIYGSVYLEQASFKELAIVLKNSYGLHLKAGSAKVRTYQFTLLLSTAQPLDKTLSIISMIHNTHYRKEANDVIIY